MERLLPLALVRPQTTLIRTIHILVCLFVVTGSRPAVADVVADATTSASDFNALFDNNSMNMLYDRFAGQYMSARVNKDVFVAQMSAVRNQLGGAPSSRHLIQEQLSTNPSSGLPLVGLRYKVTYPNAQVYQDLTLEKEAGGLWKVYGIYFNPVPTQ